MPIIPSERNDEAVRALLDGEIVAIPTDTVYGLAASLDHPAAVLRLAELKGRDPDQPIAVLIDSAEAVAEQLDDPAALDRVARHWPGALTAIVRMRDGDAWPPLVLGAAADGSKTVGLRAPDDGCAGGRWLAGPLPNATLDATLDGPLPNATLPTLPTGLCGSA